MKNKEVFFKQNILMEPLINQWYAWSYLVSPVTAPMYIANQHLKIMKSFISAPQVHVSALQNPAMIGGPFINYGADRVEDIKNLLRKTEDEQWQMLEFAQAVRDVEEMLSNEAGGYSLEPLYRKIPEPLKGYVELVYDLNNHPSVRFIEGLLYRSRYYQKGSQSIALTSIENDDRSFVFSTPRLEGDGRLHLGISFDDKGIDELNKMKYTPKKLGWIEEVLGVEEKESDLFSTFFTEKSPAPGSAYSGEAIRVRYLGHACILIESDGVSIMTDPIISYDLRMEDRRFTYADLPESLDYVLITHNHQDHCMFETLLQLRHRIKNLIVPKNNGGTLTDPSLKLALQSSGFNNVREIDEMETLASDAISITGLPFLGEHADLNIRTKIAYLITINRRSILCAADSNNIEPSLYKHVHDIVSDIDMLFLGMECDGGPMTWLYGPLLTRPLARKMDQSRRFDGSDYEKAIDIVDRLRPSQVYVYAMGQEPWLTYLTTIRYTKESRPIIESDRLVAECKRRGILSERLYIQKQIFLGPD